MKYLHFLIGLMGVVGIALEASIVYAQAAFDTVIERLSLMREKAFVVAVHKAQEDDRVERMNDTIQAVHREEEAELCHPDESRAEEGMERIEDEVIALEAADKSIIPYRPSEWRYEHGTWKRRDEK